MVRKFGVLVFSFVIMLLLHGTSFGRITRAWSFQDLADEADVIVIAHVVETKVTDERTSLSENISPPVPVRGVETKFRVLLALKGTLRSKKILLHHYRWEPPEGSKILFNGPSFVSFKNQDKRAGVSLMFLKQLPDGRCAPVSGQVDPSFSVFHLPDSAVAAFSLGP